jgi:hypothetical protein
LEGDFGSLDGNWWWSDGDGRSIDGDGWLLDADWWSLNGDDQLLDGDDQLLDGGDWWWSLEGNWWWLLDGDWWWSLDGGSGDWWWLDGGNWWSLDGNWRQFTIVRRRRLVIVAWAAIDDDRSTAAINDRFQQWHLPSSFSFSPTEQHMHYSDSHFHTKHPQEVNQYNEVTLLLSDCQRAWLWEGERKRRRTGAIIWKEKVEMRGPPVKNVLKPGAPMLQLMARCSNWRLSAQESEGKSRPAVSRQQVMRDGKEKRRKKEDSIVHEVRSR